MTAAATRIAIILLAILAMCAHLAVAVCGDGVVDTGETCDDGNVADGDGCSSACVVEEGFVCPNPNTRCLHKAGIFTSGVPIVTAIIALVGSVIALICGCIIKWNQETDYVKDALADLDQPQVPAGFEEMGVSSGMSQSSSDTAIGGLGPNSRAGEQEEDGVAMASLNSSANSRARRNQHSSALNNSYPGSTTPPDLLPPPSSGKRRRRRRTTQEDLNASASSRQQAQAQDEPVQIGMTVVLDSRPARVRYVGPVDFGPGRDTDEDWVGVEFVSGRGEHDGRVRGRRYFRCERPGKVATFCKREDIARKSGTAGKHTKSLNATQNNATRPASRGATTGRHLARHMGGGRR